MKNQVKISDSGATKYPPTTPTPFNICLPQPSTSALLITFIKLGQEKQWREFSISDKNIPIFFKPILGENVDRRHNPLCDTLYPVF